MSFEQLQKALWKLIEIHEKYPFVTYRGFKFSYRVKGGEIFVNRKTKSITQSSVNIALKHAMDLQGDVAGPKKLEVFGASYLYAMLIHFGLIQEPEIYEEAE